jgi:TMEM175 potassium channel family protein
MNKTRLEAFSDAVIAIIMTIMVLELKVPHGMDWVSLRPLIPVFLAYVMSYVYLGIYWNNHHHMLHATDHVDGLILWANLHLLFWLSLIPFTTAWMAENGFAMLPTAIYGAVLLLAAIAYALLFRAIVAHCDANQDLRDAVGRDKKGHISIMLYVLALAAAFFNQWIALSIYVLVALMWFIPDRRIERKLGHREVNGHGH